MGKKHKTRNGAEGSKPAAVTRDTSPYVPQRGKIKTQLSIAELPWTEKQKTIIDESLDKDCRIVFLSGPAGTSKTLLATYCALHLLNDKKVSDIIYLRSAVESSEAKLGFLPGTAEEKLAFYNLPFWDKINELLPRSESEILKKDERIHTFPINYIRGLNWNAKAVILDEAQNSTQKEIITTMTRLGEFSHLFILADPVQSDLNKGASGFSSLATIFGDEESKDNGVKSFWFTEEDVKRSELTKFVVKKLNRHLA